MAFQAGSVSGAFDKLISSESLGNGDGVASSYSLSFAKNPAYKNGVVFDYDVNGSSFQATSDSDGNLSGTHITSGSVDEDGIDVTFDQVIQSTDSFSATYIAKGLLTKLKEFVSDTHEEILATGDGSTSSYSGTLSNTNIALGQAQISYTINTEDFVVDLNGDDEWVNDNITSSSLNRSTGAWTLDFNDNIDSGKQVKAIYSTGSVGQDWIVLDDETTKDNVGSEAFPGLLLKQLVMKNSGKGGNDKIIIGFRECQHIPNSYYSWDLNGYVVYDRGEDWNQSAIGSLGHGKTSYDGTRESYNQHPRMSINDDTVFYNFYSSKNRIYINARITGNRDVSFYSGFLLRISPPSDYPTPLVIIGSHSGTFNFTDTGNNHSFVIEPKSASPNMFCVDPNNKFKGSAIPDTINNCIMIPKGDETTLSNAITKTTNNQVIRYPCFVFDKQNKHTLGQLEDIYYVPNNQIQSDDLLQDDAQNFRVFQNVFRNTYKDFICVEEN